MATTVYAASLVHLVGDPAEIGSEAALDYVEDGLLVVEDGVVRKAGRRQDIANDLPDGITIEEFTNAMIVPGFVDAHVHYPQLDIIASPGAQLMEWLETYTFPSEEAFADKAHALEKADAFLAELLRNGTTSALVFATVHKASVEALFEKAFALNMRLISGKVMMDRHAPESLRDTPDEAYRDSQELIDAWHNKGRLGYAVTPRFAPACSPEELQRAGALVQENPGVLLHTHLSENDGEVELVSTLFPQARDYLDVYDSYGLVGNRSVFAHAIHLSTDEWTRLKQAGAGLAFCPSSNLFLGSGLFDLKTAEHHGIKVGLGTDVGAGTSLSLLQTMNEAYKVGQLKGTALDVTRAFYLATLGGAKVLGIDDKIGNFETGKEADFVVLDLQSTPLMSSRLRAAKTIEEKLFALAMLGDDRAVKRTYLAGELAYERA